MASEGEKLKGKKLTQEQIISHFNQLRQEQKALVNKLSEVEQDLNEHSLVVEALKDVDETRTCYRMIGGVLVERTVKEVFPAVMLNKEQLKELQNRLNQQIERKGRELNEFKQQYNIQFRKDGPLPVTETTSKESNQPASSILVEKGS